MVAILLTVLDVFLLLLLMKFGFKKIELVQVSVSVLEGLGGGHYLKPRNPIVIISGEK